MLKLIKMKILWSLPLKIFKILSLLHNKLKLNKKSKLMILLFHKIKMELIHIIMDNKMLFKISKNQMPISTAPSLMLPQMMDQLKLLILFLYLNLHLNHQKLFHIKLLKKTLILTNQILSKLQVLKKECTNLNKHNQQHKNHKNHNNK